MFGVIKMTKYVFKTEKDRIAQIDDDFIETIKKCVSLKIGFQCGTERDLYFNKKIAISTIYRSMSKKVKIVNAISLKDDNSDFDEQFLTHLKRLADKKMFRLENPLTKEFCVSWLRKPVFGEFEKF